MCDDWTDAQDLGREWRTARKEHRCYACRESIRPGDRYHISAIVQDGSAESFKHCARCWAICEALWAEGAGIIDFGLNCGEEWEDNFGELPESVAALAFLTPDEAQRLAE